MRARAFAFLSLLALAVSGGALGGCHLGPFFDIHEVTMGPSVDEIASRMPRRGATLQQLLDLAGPPSRIEHRRDGLFLWWNERTLSREWYGIGVGGFGFNFQLADRSCARRPARQLLCVVKDGRVTEVGTAPPGLLGLTASDGVPAGRP